MTSYYNLSNLINLYDKSLQWISNSFNVTKTHTILIYHSFMSLRPLLCLYICTYVYTGDSRYVDFAYLDTITYVEVIFHSQHFFCIYLCISTPSMSKTVNMKQQVYRDDFSCPRRIFYYIYYCLCQSQKSALARAPYCLLRQCICITWGAKIFQTMVQNN